MRMKGFFSVTAPSTFPDRPSPEAPSHIPREPRKQRHDAGVGDAELEAFCRGAAQNVTLYSCLGNFVLLKRGWMSDLKGIRGLGLHFGLFCHPEREWAPWCVCVAEADSRQALVGGRPAAGFTTVRVCRW